MKKIVLTAEDLSEHSNTKVLGGGDSASSGAARSNVSGRNLGGSVIFDVQPNVTENGSAIYQEIGQMRQPTSLLIYMGSPSRTFQINAEFVSRTVEEANKTYLDIQKLKSWRMPEKTGGLEDMKPPARLSLRGFGLTFNRVFVRMESLSVEYPNDVDYIASAFADVPIVQAVNITLKEAKTVEELEGFNIDAYRFGLVHW